MAVAFNSNWDLVVERTEPTQSVIPPVDVSEILAGLADVIAVSDHCTDENDRLFRHLTGPVAEFEARLRSASGDDDRLRILDQAKLSHGYGRQGNWPDIDIAEVKERLKELNRACDALRVQVLEEALQIVGSALARFTAQSAEARRCAGELEFHDLLVLARDVLRSPGIGLDVRRALAQRYQRLLLDEFQDTDPIQIEIAVLIGSNDAKPARTLAQARTEAGRLFFVGDPKQSIYRFRRADIAMFMKARDELVGSFESLAKNFRTGRPIVEWVNATFSKMITREGDSQPEYQPLIRGSWCTRHRTTRRVHRQ